MITLIETKAEFVSLVPVASSVDFSAIKPELEDSVELFLKPEIGLTLIIAFDSHKNDEDGPWKTALDLAKKAIANNSTAAFIPKLSINITGSGVTRTETENEKSAFRYQEENAIAAYQLSSERALESLLKYCEVNATILSWTGPELTYLKENHLPTADAFNQFIDIGFSRRVFRKLKPFLSMIQNSRIIPTVGKPLNDTILSGGLEGHYLTIQHLIKGALANLALAEALPTLNISIGDNGATIISSAASGNGAQRAATVPQDQLSRLANQYAATGEMKVKQLLAFLQANANDISEYSSNSSVYNPDYKPFTNDSAEGGAKLF